MTGSSNCSTWPTTAAWTSRSPFSTGPSAECCYATRAQGDAWHDALFATCEQVAPGKVHVSGIDHWPWQNNAYWTRNGLGRAGTMTANHTWAGWTGVIQKYGSLSTPSTHYSEYFIEVIKAFHTDLRRRVWIEETGMSTVWMDAADIPAWTEQSIRTMASCDTCSASPGGTRTTWTPSCPATSTSSTTSACSATTARSSRSARRSSG